MVEEQNVQFSLIAIFEEVPVHPQEFSKLDTKLKWLGICEEGDNFCTNCGTLSPHIPKTHHKDCFSYLDANEYQKYENPLGFCPDCGSEDGLTLDSSREQMISSISCIDCGFIFSKPVPEEEIVKLYKKRK